MRIKELKDLRTKNIKDLKKLAEQKGLETQKSRVYIRGGKEKNLKLSSNLRHEVAKILTLIREKEIIEGLGNSN